MSEICPPSSIFIIAVATFGFTALCLFDLLQRTNRRTARLLLSAIGYISVAAAIGLQLLLFRPAPTAPWIAAPLILLAAAGFLLLLYSLFLEIPLTEPFSPGERRAVRSGTYGLVRHPGFLWFLIGELALVALYRSGEFLAVAGYLVMLDLLLVVLEDRIIFPKLMTDYQEYKQEVPFLIPTLSSILRKRRRHGTDSSGN